mmetsp:Transcript_12990/g.23104  ORF Transcript_12990/g.23104 Transcript_12990/m.23104 type:complete len:379 (-) Transcript_12990:297-1433(-)
MLRQVKASSTLNSASNIIIGRGYSSISKITGDYLKDVLRLQSPENLDAFERVLDAREMTLLSPEFGAGLHPMMVPFAKNSEGRVTGFLASPKPSNPKAPMYLPVVEQQIGGAQLELKGRGVDEFISRLLAQEEIAASPNATLPMASVAGSALRAKLAPPGAAAAAAAAGKLPLYVMRKVGMFPDVCESLSHNHLQRGDKMAALVASELGMRPQNFPGWSRPYVFAASLSERLGRHEEARDLARVSLRLPWWSINLMSFKELAKLGDLDVSKGASYVTWLLSEEAAESMASPAAAAKSKSQRPPKTKQELAYDQATFILNEACAIIEDMVATESADISETSDDTQKLIAWDTVRERVAVAYEEAGCLAAARQCRLGGRP